MKRLFLYCFLFCSLSLSAQLSADKEISFSAKSEGISEALFRLSEQSEMNITFSPKLFPKNKKVNIAAKNQPVEIVLRDCLKGTNVEFKIVNGSIALFKKVVKKHILSGYLSDAQTGERLVGANILELNSLQGGASNAYGFYSQKFAQNKLKLQISYLGYQTEIVEVDLTKSRTLDIKLQPTLVLEEILVLSKKDSVSTPGVSQSVALSLENIKQLPRVAGEADILRHIQMLPGVQGGADGFGGLHVRGGNSDQNLILLDDVPVYNPSHTFGLFSIFNPDLAKSVQFYKTGFPARYDGRVSSVLDVRTREGNSQKFSLEASAGTMATKGIMEIPLSKGKGGILLASRSSHINLWLNPLTEAQYAQEDLIGGMDYAFRDFNIKFHHSIGKKDKIYLSRYQGSDNFSDEKRTDNIVEVPNDPELEEATGGFEDDIFGGFQSSLKEEYRTFWGNEITSLRWNHLYNDKLFSNTTVTYSKFTYVSEAESEFEASIFNQGFTAIRAQANYTSRIVDYSMRTDFDYFLNESNHLRFGGNITQRFFIPGLIEEQVVSNTLDSIPDFLEDNLRRDDGIRTNEYNLYFEEQYQQGKWSLNAGLHLSAFVSQERKDFIPQPRFSATYSINKKLQTTAAITRTAQFLHLITKTDSGLPNDLWVPTGAETPPQKSWQFSTGIGGKLNEKISWNTEAYYKTLDNVFRLDRSLTNTESAISDLRITIDNRETFLERGNGNAYGLETELQRNEGKLTGRLSYAYAVTNRTFNGITRPYRYDSRHSVTCAAVYNFNPKVNISANWIFQSGLPVSEEQLHSRDLPFSSILQQTTVTLDKNNRLPAYHRLDVGLNFKFGEDRLKHNLHLGIYNAYNRKNIFFAYPTTDFQTQETKITGSYSLPILPSFSYGIKF